jgi:hypothetical protein
MHADFFGLGAFAGGGLMICIFCKEDSSSSRSVEHVIPESLGNSTLTLPPGVVCDRCNNYFARKVEKPFLDSIEMSALRFHQGIPNKRGMVPPLRGVLSPQIPVAVYRYLSGPFTVVVEVPAGGIDDLLATKSGVLILPAPDDRWSERLTSRFLAKVAVEYLATQFVTYDGGIAYLATETQLDLIRDHARRGGNKTWPYHSRRIYAADDEGSPQNDRDTQIVWECDILQTDVGELYFVLALFGLELTINYGGPEIEGYLQWIDSHDGISPLYFGKNAENPDSVPRVAAPRLPPV